MVTSGFEVHVFCVPVLSPRKIVWEINKFELDGCNNCTVYVVVYILDIVLVIFYKFHAMLTMGLLSFVTFHCIPLESRCS